MGVAVGAVRPHRAAGKQTTAKEVLATGGGSAARPSGAPQSISDFAGGACIRCGLPVRSGRRLLRSVGSGSGGRPILPNTQETELAPNIPPIPIGSIENEVVSLPRAGAPVCGRWPTWRP